MVIACENIRFSSLFAAGDVSVPPRETSPASESKSEEKRMFLQAIMVNAFLGLVTFGGSIFSGFIRSKKLLTLLPRGCYYENFTVIRNDSWFGSKCSHPYIKGELFKTKNRPQRTPAPKGWSIPQTKTGSIELKHWHNVEISIVNNCTQIDQNRPTPISKPTTLSQAEALNYIFIPYHGSFKND